ncbi:MAG: hypothetical protein NTZ95_02175 [Candidatus Omnitrophica bacterium]|nr:hypothetical protein [Candidatus Omnitrophota bacterium]
MKKIVVLGMAVIVACLFQISARAEDKVLFGFEKDTQGFEVPEWAMEQEDHVAKNIEVSKDFASEGIQSLKVDCAFPGKVWTAALVEDFEYFDWTPYKAVSVDIYIPKTAPIGLKGKMVFTVGENWKFTEMARSTQLVPGEWVTISASLIPGSEDWKKTIVDDNFRKDVRKLAVRVESNKKPEYTGPIYIDNLRLTK